MAHLPCAPTRPNVRPPSSAVSVWSKLLTSAPDTCKKCLCKQWPPPESHRPVQAFAPRRSRLHRASVRRLFRSPRHQTAADHKRQQDGNKDSKFQIVQHAFLRVGEERLCQGHGDSQLPWIDNAAINAAVPTIARHVAAKALARFAAEVEKTLRITVSIGLVCSEFIAKTASDLMSADDQNGHSIEAWHGRPQMPATRSAVCAGSHTLPLTLC